MLMLNSIFLMHGVIALLAALVSIAAPAMTTYYATGVPLGSAPISEVAKAYLAFAAAGGLLVAVVTQFAIGSSSPSARMVVLRAMLWISLISFVLAVFFLLSYPLLPLEFLLALINLVFAAAYGYVKVFKPGWI
jgi:hypothetical protein